MPYFNHRFLIIASAVLFGTALSVHAQLVDVLTEAPVTIKASIQSSATTTTPSATTTTSTTVRLTNAQVIQELINAEIIEDTSPTGWSLVAVRNAPADLSDVDASFYLYALKNGTAIAIPSSKFQCRAYASVKKYKETHLGRYVISSSGTTTNHVTCNYTPDFASDSNHYTLEDSESSGFASIKFATKDFSDDYEIFFYAISSISATTQGGYSGMLTQGSNSPVSSNGLLTLTLTVGAPKLVVASKYPDVNPASGPSVLVNE